MQKLGSRPSRPAHPTPDPARKATCPLSARGARSTPCRRGLMPLAAQPTLNREQAGTFKDPPPPPPPRTHRQARNAAGGGVKMPGWGGPRPLHRAPSPCPAGHGFSKIHLWAAPPTEEPGAGAPADLPSLKRRKSDTCPPTPCPVLLPEEDVAEWGLAAWAGVRGAPSLAGWGKQSSGEVLDPSWGVKGPVWGETHWPE